MKFITFIFSFLISCTAPTLPGVTAVGYLVEALTSKPTEQCGCLDPNEPTLITVYCKEVNGKMIRTSSTEATHMCCDACMRKLGPLK